MATRWYEPVRNPVTTTVNVRKRFLTCSTQPSPHMKQHITARQTISSGPPGTKAQSLVHPPFLSEKACLSNGQMPQALVQPLVS